MKRFSLLILLLSIVFRYGFTQIPAGYYNGTSGLTGNALKVKLQKIIRGHTKRSYSQVWTDFQSTDKKSNGKVWDMYSDVPGGTPAYEYTFGSGQCGSYSQEGDCYNREHSFPKSWWGGGNDTMYTDLFNLVPVDGYVNSQRASYCYGEVGSASWTSTNGSKLGTCNYPGYTGTVFEPIDEYKGDFARAYFYMATRYLSKFDSWAPNTDMLDGTGFSSWALNLLLDWNTQDPVSQKEIDRNNAVYNIQGNRNPFIDHPNWVNDIWNPSASSSAPVFTSGYPSTANIAATSFDLIVNQDKAGTAYFVVLSNGATAPSATQVKNGQDASGNSVAANMKGSINVAAGSTDYSATISGLTGSTDYDVYVVSEDNSSPANLQSSATLVDVQTAAGGSSTVIAEQNFESGSWNYTATAGYGSVAVSTDRSYNGTQSLKFAGSNNHNSDPYVVFDNVNISSYTNVVLEVAFSANGPDSGDDLYLDISYDNGSTWTGAGSVKLVDGYGNANVAFGATNSSDPTTVGSNPWQVNIAASQTQIKVRIRFDERSGKNNSSDYYYIDAVKLTGTSSAPSNSTESDIIKTTSWNEPQNIAYSNYIVASGLTTSNAVEVAKFTLRDGGNDISDADSYSTKLTDITLSVSNYGNIAALALFDGTTKLAEVTNVTATVSFSSLSIEAGDESSKDFSLYAGFKSTVTDNQNLKFVISLVSADANGSGFASADGGAAATDDTGDKNKIEVTADRLAFISNKPPANVGLNADFEVETEAVDANGNRDLDAAQTVSLTKASGTGALSSASGLSKALSSGLASWTDIQYNTAEDFTVSASATGLTSATSATITCANNTYFSDLIISEYVEGSSNNKYLEIWNNTGATVDLSNYRIDIYFNGNTSPGNPVNLSGTLAQGDVFVIANSSATKWSGTPDLSSGNLSFNGNDAVALVNTAAKANVDVLGTIGNNSNFAQDETLERNTTATGPSATYNSSEWTVKSQDDVSGLGNPGPLPIQLLDFSAEALNGKVIVRWQTASESDNDFFSLERSLDARNFEEVTRIAGAGSSNEIRNYSFIDRLDIQNGVLYYRLKQTDFDGNFSYGKIIAVNVKCKDFQLLSSYVEGDVLHLKIQNSRAVKLVTEIISPGGQSLFRKDIMSRKGQNHYKMTLKDIDTGVYLLRIYSPSGMLVRKIFIE